MRRGLLLLGVLVAASATAASAQDDVSGDRGQALYQHWCSGCHKPLSDVVPSVAGTSALARRYGDALPAALEEREDLTPELIALVVREGMRSMPFFRRTELSDADVAALATYLVNDPQPAE